MRYRVGDIVIGCSKESYTGASKNQYIRDVPYGFRVHSVKHDYLECELVEEGMSRIRFNLFYTSSRGVWTIQDSYLENLNKVLSE